MELRYCSLRFYDQISAPFVVVVVAAAVAFVVAVVEIAAVADGTAS